MKFLFVSGCKKKKKIWYVKGLVVGVFSNYLPIAAFVIFRLKERKLIMVKQIVTTDQNIAEETRDKLVSISSIESYSRNDLESPGNHLIDSTSEEIESSTQSILSSLDITSEKTDEDLELSAVRSIREFKSKGSTDALVMNNNTRIGNRRPKQQVCKF